MAIVGARSRLAGVGYFLMHFAEMCAATCIGMMVPNPVFAGAAGAMGYPDPSRQLPELSALVLAFNMTAPMAAWMRFRGMDWRSTGEMSGAMFAEAILIVGAYWLGIVSQYNVIPLQHTLMMPAMLVVMLYWRDSYTRHAHHHAQVA